MASNSRKKKPAARNPQGPSGKPQAGKAAGSGSTPAGTTPAGNTPAGNTTAPKTKGRQPPSPQARTAVGSGPSKSAIKRQSVASARKKSGVDKTQLYILGAAVVVIIAVIVFGFVLNNQNTAAQNDGYGSAKSTVATVQDGVITVSNNTTPPADA